MGFKKHIFLFVVSIIISLTAGQARAVIQLGDNVSVPFISLFDEDEMVDVQRYAQIVPGGPQEILISKPPVASFVPGLGGLYHANITDQRMYLPYAGGAPILFPALNLSTPDVFNSAGQLLPVYREVSLHQMGGGKSGYGIATSGGVRYLVEGRGFEVKTVATGAWVGKFIIRSVNLATRAVVWTKTYTHGTVWVGVRRCKVMDIDGDGNDEVVISTVQKTLTSAKQRNIDVFNLATGLKIRTMSWIE